MGNAISPATAGHRIHSFFFSPHNKTNSGRNKAKSFRAQLFCFFITEQLYFIIALKFSQRETYSLRVHDSYKHQLTRSIIWRERHKPAERVAVFMGKRVEKPLLSLICHKGDLWVCALRTLYSLCIDSSRAHGARSKPDSTSFERRENVCSRSSVCFFQTEKVGNLF